MLYLWKCDYHYVIVYRAGATFAIFFFGRFTFLRSKPEMRWAVNRIEKEPITESANVTLISASSTLSLQKIGMYSKFYSALCGPNVTENYTQRYSHRQLAFLSCLLAWTTVKFLHPEGWNALNLLQQTSFLLWRGSNECCSVHLTNNNWRTPVHYSRLNTFPQVYTAQDQE